MPIYFYWGEDEFRLTRAAHRLRDQALDADWISFNYDRIPPEQPDGVTLALNQALTAPFGPGQRVVWLVDTSLTQRCPEDLLAELERTLPTIPETTVLLLTSSHKPDGRLKSTKLLQKYAEVQEFSPIPSWKTDLLDKQVRQVAQELGVKLNPASIELLVEAVGSDTRQLYGEMEKLRLYAAEQSAPLDETTIAALVTATSQNTFQLAAAIRQGETGQALELVGDLLQRNEPALRIVASLTNQFRTWLWLKLMADLGERDERKIAEAAEVGNPKRIYFLQKEVQGLTLAQLQQTLPLLLELEFSLKDGVPEQLALQTKVIELCQVCCRRPGSR